jgi:hypothetical protein
VIYRVMKKERDLWGWSCSAKAKAIQPLYVGVLDFEELCTLQVSFFPFHLL